MFKQSLIALLFLSLPFSSFGFAGGGMGDLDDQVEDATENVSLSSCEDEEEVEKVRCVIKEVRSRNLVQKVNGGYGCLQGPSGKLYKEAMSTINSSVKHLNNDFGPADSGRWYIVEC